MNPIFKGANMYLLFIAACFAADPIPDNVREYLKQTDDFKAAQIKPLQEKLRNFEADLRFETARARQGTLKLSIRQTQAAIDALYKAKLAFPLPSSHISPVDTIGLLGPGTVETVIDKQTAIVKVRGQSAKIILTNIDTTEMKSRTQFISQNPWQVVPTNITDEQVERVIGKGYTRFSVKPLTHDDIEKYRPQYETERDKPQAPKP